MPESGALGGGTTAAFDGRMTRFVLRLALPVLLVAAVVAPARADEAPAPITPLVTTEADPFARWYGWQTLLADAAGIGASIGCAQMLANTDGELACVTPFLLASPAVHMAHGNPGRSAISFAVNLVLPVGGAAIGAAMADCGKDEFLCGLSETGLGLLVGLTAAMTVYAVIAFEDAEAPRRTAARQPALLPTVALTSGGAGVGLAGRF